jgi:exopolysaccharide biosynthesis protein
MPLPSARTGKIQVAFLLVALAAAIPLFLLHRAYAARGERVAPGIVLRRVTHGLATVRVLDVDLSAPGVRVEIAADEIAVREGRITGRAYTVPDWLKKTGAAAGINGGFFGATLGEHKEVVGLLKRQGRVRVAAPSYRSRSGATYARSALGFTSAGEARMGWVTSRPGHPQQLRSHPAAEFSGSGTPWTVAQALACGPRLVRNGRPDVAARGERLASPGALPRTFLGFGGAPGKTHLVLCVTEGMEFADCARFLAEYFPRECGGPCREGMALDGGSSTQMAWRERGRITADPDPGVTVPTAVLVYSGRR